ncbi:putative transcriptional regulator [Burkholderia sp. Ch1-1]|nr:putative transcriptional regulator [Burkholderia sp. Ch1-1]
MNLAERIQTVLDEVDGIDQVKLAEAAGVTKGTVNQWLTGQIKSIKLEYAVGIQERFGYNPVWLVMGKGSKKVPGIHHEDAFNPIPFPPGKRIPVLGMAQLGDNGFWAEVEYPVGHGEGYLDFPSRDRDAYGIRCVGDSMLPRIKDGEFVVIEPNHPVENGDEVLVKAKDGRVMIKILLYQRAGRTHLMSVNTEHAPLAIETEKIERLHYVAAIVKSSMWKHE